MNRLFTISAALGLFLSPMAFAEPATQPTTQPMAGTFEAYQTEGTALEKQYKVLVPSNDLLADSNPQRSVLAGETVPLLKKIVVDLDGMAQTKPAYKWPIVPVRATAQAEMYALGDPETVSLIDRNAPLPGRDGIRAKRILMQARWLMAGQDVDKQTKLLTDLDQFAQFQPSDSVLSMEITEMASSAADAGVKQHLLDLLSGTMDNMSADAGIRKVKNDDKTHSFEGKPMVLSGKLASGQDFTTADWKGRVVLVDFWAAWCTPCKAELPRVQKVYDQYHEKGFEVLGVDNDYTAKSVLAYCAKANLPWPQLFDSAAGAKDGWNPLTLSFGINGIPVMFLIDKKGICRTVSARDNFETLIPQMLAE